MTNLDYGVLNGMMDDYEDVEQLYLGLKDQFALRDVIDAVKRMLRDGFIEVRYTNDEVIAPVNPINNDMIYHYWFGPTPKGKAAWQSFSSTQSK